MLAVAALATSAIPSPVLAKQKHASELKRAERLGSLINEKDRAAWLASDRLFADGSMEGIIGWITIGSDGGWLVAFLGGTSSAPCVTMFRARQTALASMTLKCSDKVNTVVLPGKVARKDGWFVYVLAATAEPGKLMLGGHHRVLVSSDGSTADQVEPLSNGCLTLSFDPTHEPDSAFVTHVISKTPLETHVFLTLSTGIPLYVGTDDVLWAVEEGKIRLVMSGKDWQDYQNRAIEEASRADESPSE